MNIYLLMVHLKMVLSLDIINSYQEKIEQKGILYKAVSEPDEGLYDAMNKGVRLAEGGFYRIC